MKNWNLRAKAFTLVELLITLIVISCIVAAFAPVMTKKAKMNVSASAGKNSGQDGVLYSYDTNDPSCKETAAGLECYFKAPDGVNLVNAVIVAGGGGGGGSWTPKNSDGTETKTMYDTFNTIANTTKHPNRTKVYNASFDKVEDIKIDFMIGGGGGGSSAFWYSSHFPQSQKDCEDVANADGAGGVVLVANRKLDSVNGYGVSFTNCIRKDNASINAKLTTTKCTDYTKACCYRGTADLPTFQGGDTAVQTKHVCNKTGAKEACAQYGSHWKVVGNNFWDQMGDTSIGNNTRRYQILNSELRLCASAALSSNSKALYYCERAKYCSNDTKWCRPACLWTSEDLGSSVASSTLYYYNAAGNITTQSSAVDVDENFASTKCGAYNKFDDVYFMKYAGGYGGSAGIYIQDFTIPKAVIDELNKKGGKISIAYGLGGTGGGAYYAQSDITGTSSSNPATNYFAYKYNTVYANNSMGSKGGNTVVEISANTGGKITITTGGGHGGSRAELEKDVNFGNSFKGSMAGTSRDPNCATIAATGTLAGKIVSSVCGPDLTSGSAYGGQPLSWHVELYDYDFNNVTTIQGGNGGGSAFNAWNVGQGGYSGGGVAASRTNWQNYTAGIGAKDPGAGGSGGSLIGSGDTTRTGSIYI